MNSTIFIGRIFFYARRENFPKMHHPVYEKCNEKFKKEKIKTIYVCMYCNI